MKNVEEILDIETVDVEVKEVEEVVPQISDAPEDIDYEYIRKNYYNIIKQGHLAIKGALKVAQESDHPRAYEVVGGLLRHLADINRQLIQIGEDKQRIKIAKKGLGLLNPPQVTNNTAVFVGNSADFSKLLKKNTE